MTPLLVPIAMVVDTAMQVGRPKFRFPISENTCPVIFLSFVHRITSHGAAGDSCRSGVPVRRKLAREEFLECPNITEGEADLCPLGREVERRLWNRRSNGRWDPTLRLDGEARRPRTLLLDERIDPYTGSVAFDETFSY